MPPAAHTAPDQEVGPDVLEIDRPGQPKQSPGTKARRRVANHLRRLIEYPCYYQSAVEMPEHTDAPEEKPNPLAGTGHRPWGRFAIRLDGLGDVKRYPKTHFLKDFLQILVLIAFVVLAVRAFEWFVWWTGTWLPGHGIPTEFESYLPIVHTRWIVTVLETVSEILVTVVAIYTVVKMVKSLLGRSS